MSNILFVGPYRQFDGWGIASRHYIKAFQQTSHEIFTRPVYLSNNASSSYSEEGIDVAERKYAHQYDIVVQNCLPFHFARYGDAFNVGLCFFESGNLELSSWIDSINLLDLLLVPSKFEKKCLKESGVTIPIKVVPVPYDSTRIQKKAVLTALNDHNDEFKFYFVGEFNKRKNIEDTVVAFHREFMYGENVRLVLKLSGADPQALFDDSSQQLDKIKEHCGLYPTVNQYRSEVLLTSPLNETEILALHNTCDCFLSTSYGESIGLGAMDAMAFGKTPIINKNSGTSQFIDQLNGFPVESFKVPAIDKNRPTPDLYKTSDTWYKIDILDLQAKMRSAFEVSLFEKQEKFVNSMEVMEKHSYQNIGKIIESIL